MESVMAGQMDNLKVDYSDISRVSKMAKQMVDYWAYLMVGLSVGK